MTLCDKSSINKISALLFHNRDSIEENAHRQLSIAMRSIYEAPTKDIAVERYKKMQSLLNEAERDKKLPDYFHAHIMRYVYEGLGVVRKKSVSPDSSQKSGHQ